MSRKYEWPEHYIDRFFSRMATIFPGWGNGVDKEQWRIEWRAVLEVMDPQKINAVINFCRDEYTHKPSFKEIQLAYAMITGTEREYFTAQERPSAQPTDSQAVIRHVDAILSRLGKPTASRWIPPSREYAAAIEDAKNGGRSAYEVDVEFLPKHGWSHDRERQYLYDVSVIAFGRPERFFPMGHEPQSIEWALSLVSA